MTNQVGPHGFRPRGWRFWICTHCYAPRAAHPMHAWVKARPLGDNRYVRIDTLSFEDLHPGDKP